MSKNKVTIHTDGASRGNPGLAGAGVVLTGLERQYLLSVFLGKKTNNEAEYLAVLHALRFLVELLGEGVENKLLKASSIHFKLDSKLVVEQLSSNWKIKNPRMKKLVEECQGFANQLELPISFEHVGRELNEKADWLANEAIDLAYQDF